jgi:hypothetical protein
MQKKEADKGSISKGPDPELDLTSKLQRSKEEMLESFKNQLDVEHESALADSNKEFYVINQEKKSKKIMLEVKQGIKNLEKLNAWEPAYDEYAADDEGQQAKA